jgi:hypothetical protein
MIILISVEKALKTIQHPFMIKTWKELRIEGMFFIVIKTTYDKLIVNIIQNGKELKPFPPNSGIRKGCPLSPLLFNIVLEFLVRAIRYEQEIKRSK